MKRLISLIVFCSMLPGLWGCGSVYSNYREVEQILAIQTMGLDSRESGVRLTLAAPSTTRTDGSPICLSGDGPSITTAIERIRNYSTEEDLFCAHINHVLLGEDAAKKGIDSVLTYICRSPEMRIDTPLYIVRGNTAEEMIGGAVEGGAGICEVLDAVKTNADERGDSTVFTAAQVVRDLDRHGSALICALELADADELTMDGGQQGGQSGPAAQDGQEPGGDGEDQPSPAAETAPEGQDAPSPTPEEGGENPPPETEQEALYEGAPTPPLGRSQGKTAAVAGYGIIRGEKLCGYISREDAVGAGILLNRPGVSDLVVTDKTGGKVTLEVSQGESRVVPVWDGEGNLAGIDIYAKVTASLHEIEHSGSGQDWADFITGQLEAAVSERMRSVLQTSKRLRSDFLGLGDRVELAAPGQFRALEASFSELLPGLEFRLSVSGRLSHTNNLKDA